MLKKVVKLLSASSTVAAIAAAGFVDADSSAAMRKAQVPKVIDKPKVIFNKVTLRIIGESRTFAWKRFELNPDAKQNCTPTPSMEQKSKDFLISKAGTDMAKGAPPTSINGTYGYTCTADIIMNTTVSIKTTILYSPIPSIFPKSANDVKKDPVYLPGCDAISGNVCTVLMNGDKTILVK